jgi:glycosyltransferase involved in cell wall biosynthesis
MLSKPEISVITPLYNERENLAPLVEEIEKALAPTGRSFELIAIDDGSTDGSTALLKDLISKKSFLRGVFFRKNAGQTAAFDAGFRHASGKIIVTMDSDLQNDPKDIPPMIALLEQGYDFVAGWRKDRKDGFFLRKIPSRIANRMIRKVTKTKIHDLGCSLKVYRKEITDELRLYGEMHRFIGPLVEGVGGKVAEFVVNHRARSAGTSKYGLSRTFKVMLDLLTVWFMRSYQTKPIYVFGGTGFAMLGLGAITAAYVLWDKFGNGVWVHKNPLFLIAIMFTLIGVLFVGIGLIAEIIMRTYFESQGKSTYFLAETKGFKD